MDGGGQAEAWLLQKVLAEGPQDGVGGGRGSSVFPFAAFSAHSPSCLLRASLAAVTATPQY